MFQEVIKNFGISFDGLNERNTFSAGDLITGKISFDLTKETKINALTLKMKGGANVHWSKTTGSGKKRRRKHYSARTEFFNYKNVLMQSNSDNQTTKLPPGRHVYPFSCQLPQGDFPSSFHGTNGQISYSLTVGIDRPWHLSKEFITELKFVSHINPNQPGLWAPLSGSNSKTLCCLWCASGPITMAVSLEKKAFKPGETAKILCSFSNASSRTVTPKVKLQQKQMYYTHGRRSRKMMFKQLGWFTGEPINAHTSDVQTEIMLTIPSSASLTVSNCSILEVDYLIEVSLSVRGSSDLTVLFPIILYEVPSHSYPPTQFL